MDTQTFTQILHWLQLHSHWAIFLIFFFSLLESIVLVGLLIPGTVVMTAAGVLVGSGILPLVPVVLFSALAAFIGDVFSYGVGLYFRDNTKRIWPFYKFPQLLHKGEVFFQKHGGKSVFIGRFVGPVRPIIPLIAGTLNMSWRRFIPIDLIACLLWPILYMLPGIILGIASLALPAAAASKITLYFIILLILIFFVYWLIQLSITSIIKAIDKAVFKFWQLLKRHPRCKFFYNVLKSSHIPDSHSQLGIAIFAILFALIFLIIMISVLTHTGIYHINEPLHHFFRSAFAKPIEKVMLLITYIGYPKSLSTFWACLLIYFVLRRQWYIAAHWFALGLFTSGCVIFIKHAVASPRPGGLHTLIKSYSFPSGHTTLSTAFFSFLAIMFARDKDEYFAWFCYIFAAILILLIGLSRLYLGAHWPCDVLGGFSLGLAISLFVALFYRHRHYELKQPVLLFIIVLGLIACLWGFRVHKDFKNDINAFTPVWPSQKISLQHWWRQGLNKLPEYRTDRLGHKIQTLNIEWLGSLKHIETYLQQQEWQHPPQSVLVNTIRYFSEQDEAKRLPLLPALYNAQKPSLVMTKPLNGSRQVLVLRLWNSHTKLYEKDKNLKEQLWVGSISYINHHLIHPNQKFSSKIKPLDFLTKSLHDFHWKFLHYSTQAMSSPLDTSWDGRVMLIK